MNTTQNTKTEAMITRAVSKGANPTEARALLAGLIESHRGDNLAHALSYNGFATAAQAARFAA